MEIRKAAPTELEEILTIYSQARDFMRDSGNETQWAGGYPDRKMVEADIKAENLYVCLENGEILGVFYYSEGPDKTYEKIYDGCWKSSEQYSVIHRIAVSKNAHGKGVAAFCFSYCFGLSGNIRIDTHRDNLPMQRALEKNGFSRCGVILLENGEERIAFQKY